MPQFNFFKREVLCKIMYYGADLSGKTTNIEVVHLKTPKDNRSDLICTSTEKYKTLFFDFSPIDLGNVAGMQVKLRLCTHPGALGNVNDVRRYILKDTDGIIFVADSQEKKVQENINMLQNLKENLAEHGVNIENIPMVIQWNKRDMPGALDIATLERKINYLGALTEPAIASTGEGVFLTLKKCAILVLESVNKKVRENNKTTIYTPIITKNPNLVNAPIVNVINIGKKKPIFKKFEKR